MAIVVWAAACDISDPTYTGAPEGARVAVIGDGMTYVAADGLRAQLALTDEVRIGATAAISVGGSLARATEMSADAPDVVVVQLGVSESWNPKGFDGTKDLPDDPVARAELVDRTRGDLAELYGVVGGSCTVGVTVPALGAPPGHDPDVSAAVNDVVRSTADVVVDLDAALASGEADFVFDDSHKLSEAGVQLYADVLADAVRECRTGPDGPLTVSSVVDGDRDVLEVTWQIDTWSVEGIRARADGPAVRDYDVALSDWPAATPANRGTDPVLEVPLSSAEYAVDLEVGLHITVHYWDGTAAGPLDGSFVHPAQIVVPESTEWVAGDAVEVVDEATRQARRMNTWPDGNIGFAELDGTLYGFAANGAGYSRWTTTPNRFVGEVRNRSSKLEGLPEDVDYAAGGPVYVDPASGDVLMWYHAEKYPGGDPLRFWSFIGLAVSHDGGATFEDLGPIVTPNIPMDHPGRTWATEVGGAPYIIRGEWFYMYFRETTAAGEALHMSVARARVDDVVAAAKLGQAAPWTKRRSGWGQPGLGGEAFPLFADGPPPRWFDVVELVDQGRYLMVSTDGHGGSWTYVLRTSTNGLDWSAPTRIDIPTGGDEALYLSLSSPDRASQRQVVGDTVHLYRTRTEVRSWLRWQGEIGIDRIELTAVP